MQIGNDNNMQNGALVISMGRSTAITLFWMPYIVCLETSYCYSSISSQTKQYKKNKNKQTNAIIFYRVYFDSGRLHAKQKYTLTYTC